MSEDLIRRDAERLDAILADPEYAGWTPGQKAAMWQAMLLLMQMARENPEGAVEILHELFEERRARMH